MEDERILRTRRALMQDRQKVREWYREAKAYLAQQAKTPTTTHPYVPQRVLNYILVNMLLWIILITALYIASGGELVQATIVFLVLALVLAVMLLIQMLVWRLYWFFVAIQWSCATIALVVLLIAVLAGAVSLRGIIN